MTPMLTAPEPQEWAQFYGGPQDGLRVKFRDPDDPQPFMFVHNFECDEGGRARLVRSHSYVLCEDELGVLFYDHHSVSSMRFS